MHFCAVVARVYSRRSLPRNTSLNWFIPALVKSNVGSPCGTSDELRKRLCPLPSKKRRNTSRISFPLKVFDLELHVVMFALVASVGAFLPFLLPIIAEAERYHHCGVRMIGPEG